MIKLDKLNHWNFNFRFIYSLSKHITHQWIKLVQIWISFDEHTLLQISWTYKSHSPHWENSRKRKHSFRGNTRSWHYQNILSNPGETCFMIRVFFPEKWDISLYDKGCLVLIKQKINKLPVAKFYELSPIGPIIA